MHSSPPTQVFRKAVLIAAPWGLSEVFYEYSFLNTTQVLLPTLLCSLPLYPLITLVASSPWQHIQISFVSFYSFVVFI